jgi:hypothetical protein
LCRGYRIDFMQAVQKALCFPSSHTCKFLCTKQLCNGWFCSVPFSVPNMSLQVLYDSEPLALTRS